MICPVAVPNDLSDFGRPGRFGASPCQEVPLVPPRVRRGAGDAYSGSPAAGDQRSRQSAGLTGSGKTSRLRAHVHETIGSRCPAQPVREQARGLEKVRGAGPASQPVESGGERVDLSGKGARVLLSQTRETPGGVLGGGGSARLHDDCHSGSRTSPLMRSSTVRMNSSSDTRAPVRWRMAPRVSVSRSTGVMSRPG